MIILYFVVIIVILIILYWFFMSSYSQTFGYFPYKINTSQKVIALTFDDGPNEPYTSELLDFLKDKQVKATFFLVGKNVKKYPDTVKRILKEGHTIANHSYSHEFKNYFKSLNFKDQIVSNQKVIKSLTGLTPRLYRSPWLFRSPYILASLKKTNLTPVSGIFCHPLEILRINPQRIANKAIRNARPGTILIFHDGIEGRGGNRQTTIDATKIFVNQLLENDYQFSTVDKLLNIPPYEK